MYYNIYILYIYTVYIYTVYIYIYQQIQLYIPSGCFFVHEFRRLRGIIPNQPWQVFHWTTDDHSANTITLWQINIDPENSIK